MCPVNSEMNEEIPNQPNNAESSTDKAAPSGSCTQEENPEKVISIQYLEREIETDEMSRLDDVTVEICDDQRMNEGPLPQTTFWNVERDLINLDEFLRSGSNFAEPNHGLTGNVLIMDIYDKNWTVFCPLIPPGMDFFLG